MSNSTVEDFGVELSKGMIIGGVIVLVMAVGTLSLSWAILGGVYFTVGLIGILLARRRGWYK